VAHQVSHLGNPFATSYMAAPAGVKLGFDTLIPATEPTASWRTG
jgi:hypothetical protein